MNYIPMIVLKQGDSKILLITQLEHQDLAGQIAAVWGNSDFSEPEPFSPMVAAAGNHDNGWWERDIHPTVNPKNGLPYAFTELPVLEWLLMYKRGIERIAECDPYEGLMVGMHGVGLRKNRYGTVPATDRRDRLTSKEENAVRDYITSGEKLQGKLRRKLSSSPLYRRHSTKQRVWNNYELLQVWDRLSLYLCSGGQSGGIKDGVLSPTPSNYSKGDLELHLERRNNGDVKIKPFPLKKSPARMSVRGRLIPDKHYGGDEELRRAYYAGESTTMAFNIVSA
ncbi:MAG: DUF3891 family protein [Nitrososphaerales archaeon]